MIKRRSLLLKHQTRNVGRDRFAPRARIPSLSLTVIGLVAGLFTPTLVRAQSKPDPTFRDFAGVNGGGPAETTRELGVGWVRIDFSWNTVEPQKGKWNFTVFDNFVQRAHSVGVEVLPTLDYTASWAAPPGGGQYSAPNEADWEDYVEHVVEHYSQPPFNLRYFQIWNEPAARAFWRGSNEEYIDKLYLPAAQIIRKHHCYVVLGGWPSSSNVQVLDAILNYHNAWQYTDIVDVHYYQLPAWEHLYETWVANGKCKGVWQTEIGWTDLENLLPNTYLRVLYWALQKGWRDPNEFKAFWYRFSGSDHAKSLTSDDGGTTLNGHGIRMATLNKVLGGGDLALFTQFSSTPAMPFQLANSSPAAMGFKVGGGRIVIAVIVDQPTFRANRPVALSIAVPAQPSSVQALSATGQVIAAPSRYAGGRVELTVPANRLAPGNVDWTGRASLGIGYVVIDY
jgi:Beta-galactosidase